MITKSFTISFVIDLLIILKVLFLKSEKKRFEDYKILKSETSEITRKKFSEIVKSEINKISQVCENSHYDLRSLKYSLKLDQVNSANLLFEFWSLFFLF